MNGQETDNAKNWNDMTDDEKTQCITKVLRSAAFKPTVRRDCLNSATVKASAQTEGSVVFDNEIIVRFFPDKDGPPKEILLLMPEETTEAGSQAIEAREYWLCTYPKYKEAITPLNTPEENTKALAHFQRALDSKKSP